MTDRFKTAMQRSLQHVLAEDPDAATRVIKNTLGIEGAQARAAYPGDRDRHGGSVGRSLRDTLKALKERPAAPSHTPRPSPSRPDIHPGATFDRHRFTCAAGTRDYFLFVPATGDARVRGVIMMLHGCTHTGLDFAAGTAMNEEAERHGFAVIYPQQSRNDNSSSCWNWFRPSDQQAGGGEPAILSALALEIAERLGAEKRSVFAAGLSAGGAMAAILGHAYPQVFSAIGVHSGLPVGAAHDVPSAFSVMQSGAGQAGITPECPAIVFHGVADRTVSVANAALISGTLSDEEKRVVIEGGRKVVVTFGRNTAGRSVELWIVEGGGHAWFGGHSAGSFTEQGGPAASSEMMRFFLRQR